MKITQTITRSARLDPDGIATRFLDRQRTHRELADRSARLAGALVELGVRSGDPAAEGDARYGTRVAFLGLNSDRYLEFFLGVPWAGGVFVPVNVRLAPPEIVYWLTDSGAEVLLVDDAFAPVVPVLREQVPTLRHVVFAGEGETPEGLLAYEDLVAGSAPIEPRDRGGDELAGLFYTGGTTGRSKGVMLSHTNLLIDAFHALPTLGLSRESRYLHVGPMFHLANGAGMFGALVSGSSHVIVDRFTPEGTAVAIERHAVTHALLVPTMIGLLVVDPAARQHDLSSLRGLLYGGSPMTESVIQAAQELLPGAGLVQAYGQSEAGPILTMLSADRHVFEGPLAGKTRSGGEPVIGVDVAILDDDGNELPRGTVGEICGRGDNVMAGYWNLPEQTAKALRHGWLYTGDAGYMDEDGFVFVVDRLKDMIVTGGENVYTAEVENAVAAHPDVVECAVIGIPSEKWGEQVHAVVTVREGATLDEQGLIDHCKQLIANYKCPRSVEVRHDELPRSGAGKILKTTLREPFWAGRERSVA
ncbi:long-chain-fatty-acid--CoA ligase [Patulibacter defluvii]|uniref:long-chain-fatty-acid--CoA ligase n=1 Tax=Patulibacter defluvii TaxID=3095358 RepID=UPI002A757F1E|nr:long-chain-fatty-acid--CoA ligase [Patulibacter sp. DM4]